MDITLADVIALEPNLIPTRGSGPPDRAQRELERVEVSWAVTARTTVPHLPALRGREILLVPARVAAELGDDLSALIREATAREISAVVMAERGLPERLPIAAPTEVPILSWRGELTGDVEMQVNRRLTECRGELYRVGSELERQLADLTVSGAGVAEFAQVTSQATGLPISVFDRRGLKLATAGMASGPPGEVNRDDRAYVWQEFRGGSFALGPLRPEQRVTARFLVHRLALAAEAAMQQDDAAKPRGPRRIGATEALLSGRVTSASEQRAAALALGLDPDAIFLVATGRGCSETAFMRALAPLGAVHPAGDENGRRLALIDASGRASGVGLAERLTAVKRNWESEHAGDGATLAFSAPALGVASVPAAAREAAFVDALQAQSAFSKRAASFASVDDVGALRLLYHLRESSELRGFVDDALGTLQSRDRRGTLRATLRAFLETGGSQVAASQQLGIHRNTLAYRLRRIAELVGRDIADPASWLTLHLALRAADVLDAHGEDR